MFFRIFNQFIIELRIGFFIKEYHNYILRLHLLTYVLNKEKIKNYSHIYICVYILHTNIIYKLNNN